MLINSVWREKTRNIWYDKDIISLLLTHLMDILSYNYNYQDQQQEQEQEQENEEHEKEQE